MIKNKTVDLFAGMGGIRLAFDNAGFETVFSNDIEHNCKKTYDLNFKDCPMILGDINLINTFPDFDILLGGFPCQPFSVAGKLQGEKDTRGQLFYKILNIIKENKPKAFFLENVKNLKGKRFEDTFNMMISELSKQGYEVHYSVLNSCEYGNVLQNRERVYIVGFREDIKLKSKFIFPEKIQLNTTINDVLQQKVANAYYYNDKPLWDKLKDFEFEKGSFYQWRRKYVRKNKSGVCPTLTANMGTGGHNVPIIFDGQGVRKLTPRECANIQGFPKEYKLPNIADSHLYKQIGNSVSVPVVSRIAKRMFNALH